jgi:hypothetical protein
LLKAPLLTSKATLSWCRRATKDGLRPSYPITINPATNATLLLLILLVLRLKPTLLVIEPFIGRL